MTPPKTKTTKRSRATTGFTTPGLTSKQAQEAVALLQDRLYACTDLHLTLKHVHWNVVGPQFIAVHTMIDPQVDAVRLMADVLAERIATLGGISRRLEATLSSRLRKPRWTPVPDG